jgi:hypothetical protein
MLGIVSIKGRQSLGNKFRSSQGEGELLLSLSTVDQLAISNLVSD